MVPAATTPKLLEQGQKHTAGRERGRKGGKEVSALLTPLTTPAQIHEEKEENVQSKYRVQRDSWLKCTALWLSVHF